MQYGRCIRDAEFYGILHPTVGVEQIDVQAFFIRAVFSKQQKVAGFQAELMLQANAIDYQSDRLGVPEQGRLRQGPCYRLEAKFSNRFHEQESTTKTA